MVLSVSKTYIRLKDLIMEKKFLQKETRKLKNLNSHLESRLGEQEQRLGAVTIELNKTWNLVGRMQRQHRQLHTHEQVLRYQLQQKRRMLSELKEELEYCRRKWDLAKEKNNESQSQWETLRLEFSKRKECDLNNSGESGYSDSPASEDDDDDDEEDSIETQRNSRLKKKHNNMEQFLLTSDQKDRKVVRIHSVSPARITKGNLVRRNSDSQITLFATEVFQTTSDEVQPIVHQNICAECGENCVKHSVHFDSVTLEQQKSNDQVKVSKPVVRKELTNAQKLIESKASTSKTKMSSELRKTTATPKSSTSKNSEESLEDMFLRLSGSGEREQSSSREATDSTNENQTDSNENRTESIESQDQVDSVVNVPISQEERELRRVARIERLEGQCKLLMKQVTRASSRGDELNRRINEVHSRYTPVRETEPNQNSVEPQPSTSTQATPVEKSSKTDEQCLSVREVEYLSRRDERLKRLEAESQAYMNRVKSINRSATDVETKLEFLHGRYGSESNGGESSTKTETSNQQNTSDTDRPIDDSQPSTSGSEKTEQPSTSDEQCLSATEKEYLARREERLKRLEAESQAYTNRIKAMNERATNVDNKLELLHERHGNNDENANSSANTPNQLFEESSNQQQQQSDANQRTDDPQSNQNDEEPSSSQ